MKLLVTLLYALTLCEAFAQPDKGRPLYKAGDMDYDVCLVLSRGDSTSYVSCMAICLASFGLVGFELGQIHGDLQLWEVCGPVYGAQCLCHGNNTLPEYIIMSRALQDQGLAHHDCVEALVKCAPEKKKEAKDTKDAKDAQDAKDAGKERNGRVSLDPSVDKESGKRGTVSTWKTTLDGDKGQERFIMLDAEEANSYY
ncbi:uncharacterized protein K444DRAFT_633858 [Hyaloscypha bicolor E]|uniref:Uncharacterized protein n=1 Tax=Hyaloscypha bicolor E TaxID=1095630 RepID=A0A2J6SW26_9HELO|nr:uncharacterized protein K444DRAFT_633858 [Hyaloscypha bicolor E]PMD54974.1 hypothetical protein K444DRAFT_633858 [Hyaloscypha bicolor E]